MVLMALDHTRDFFTSQTIDPLDLGRTNAGLFLTRWITHLVAPVFVLLAGTGAFLSLRRRRTRAGLSRYLLTRGLWLILLEFTVVHFGWNLNFDLHSVLAQVIWALGWSMVVLSALVWLPLPVIGAFGVALIGGHNLFDGVRPASLGVLGDWWTVLHVPGSIQPLPGYRIRILYPLIPWIGVIAAGYAIGPLWSWNAGRRKRLLLALGAGLTLLFVLLRASNVYGDMQTWTPQRDWLWTLFSFVNTTKYPPSLLYLLMTLGPALVMLAFSEGAMSAVTRPFIIFGRVPLFYYIVHLPFIHLLAVTLANLHWSLLPVATGLDLPRLYVVWLASVALLFPVCRWFMQLKERRSEAWLSYL